MAGLIKEPMSTVGLNKKKTMIEKNSRETLHYDYLDNWTDQEGNHNIEEVGKTPGQVQLSISARCRRILF